METMIQCILHLPEGPKKALLLYRQEPETPPRRRRISRSRQSTAANRRKVLNEMTEQEFDDHCRLMARDEITRVRMADEFQEGMRGVARYEAKREIVKVLKKAQALEEAAR
jgi:hypothetical protein